MNRDTAHWTAAKRFHTLIQRLIQTRIWGMDIHPTANIEPTALIDRTWPRGIHIGADCLICEEAVILTHDAARSLSLDTTIGARCYVGPRAIIMPGVSIGAHSIVMPGAVVTKDMPPDSRAIGNPAQIEPRSLDGSSGAESATG